MNDSVRILLVASALGACATPPPPPPSATFEVRQEFTVKLPDGAHDFRMWATMPQDDSAQTVADFRVDAPLPHRIERDSAGNGVVYIEGSDPAVREFKVVETFRVTRSEIRAPAPGSGGPIAEIDRAKFAGDLAGNANVVITDDIRAKAAEVVGSETDSVRAARRIYDWVLANVDYWVKDPEHKKASPVGSSDYCMTSKTGNCTDFHSLWAAMARASGIPTRMVYGVLMKQELDGQDVDSSYHCWIEFLTPRAGWVSLDVAVADIYAGGFELNDKNAEKVRRTTADGYTGPDPAKVEFYFGNLEDRRVTMSSGRDLDLSPPQAGPRVNHLPKAYCEIDGAAAAETKVWTRKLTYRQLK